MKSNRRARPSMHRCYIARNRRAINLSYVDMHVAVVELEDLWAQY